MNLAAALYIPGVPSRATPIVSAIIIFSILLGFSFRNVFPTFSIFAWGIPASIIISIIVQMMGLSLAQALKIRELEKKLGNLIRPTTKPN
jgi:flagellar biosynthesis protein FliR